MSLTYRRVTKTPVDAPEALFSEYGEGLIVGCPKVDREILLQEQGLAMNLDVQIVSLETKI